MTSGLAVPRVAMSATPHVGGARTPNLPVIEHPMAKLGNKNELTIRGSSSLGRHNDLGMVHAHQNGRLRHSVDLGVRNTLSPHNKIIRSSVDVIPGGGKERLIHWPPGNVFFSFHNSNQFRYYICLSSHYLSHLFHTHITVNIILIYLLSLSLSFILSSLHLADETQARITERLLSNREGKPMSPRKLRVVSMLKGDININVCQM